MTQTRTLSCQRSDGVAVADALCTDARLPTTLTSTDTSSCTYAWDPGAWNAWDNTCTATATRIRSIYCRRSDGSLVGSAFCTGTLPTSTETSSVYSGCGYSWAAKSYGSWSDSCSQVATRSIDWGCKRSDGTFMTDLTLCSAIAKPSSLSAPTVVTDSCEQSTNGNFSNGFTGWYGMKNVTLADTGGGNIAAKFVTSGTTEAAIAQNATVIKNRVYNLHVEWTSASAAGKCSVSADAPIAIWKFPNGFGAGANGSFVFDKQQICGTTKYVRDFPITADYTGSVQIVLWLHSDGTQLTAYLDNVSFVQLP